MRDHNHFLQNEQAAKLINNSAKLEQLRDSPETQKIFSMLSRNIGGNLEQAAGNAAKGDSAQLISAIRQLMQDPEGSRLIQQMKEKLK